MRVLIVTRNSTDGNNHNEILYVVFHYIIIKYKHVNIIWIFIFFSVFSLLIDGVIFILFKILIHAQMYLTEYNTDRNVATCSLPIEGEHIISNDYCVRQSAFL